MAFLCKTFNKQPPKEKTKKKAEPILGGGRLTGSDSVDTLVRVGLEKEAGVKARIALTRHFTACTSGELTVTAGQQVWMLYQDGEWLYVIDDDNCEGFVPAAYCSLVSDSDDVIALYSQSGKGTATKQSPSEHDMRISFSEKSNKKKHRRGTAPLKDESSTPSTIKKEYSRRASLGNLSQMEVRTRQGIGYVHHNNGNDYYALSRHSRSLPDVVGVGISPNRDSTPRSTANSYGKLGTTVQHGHRAPASEGIRRRVVGTNYDNANGGSFNGNNIHRAASTPNQNRPTTDVPQHTRPFPGSLGASRSPASSRQLNNNPLPITRTSNLHTNNVSVSINKQLEQRNSSDRTTITTTDNTTRLPSAIQPVTGSPVTQKSNQPIQSTYHDRASQNPPIAALNSNSNNGAVHAFKKCYLGHMTVLYDFAAVDRNDVSVRRNEHVTVLNTDDVDWFWVQRADGREGFVPSSYLLALHPTGHSTAKPAVHTPSWDQQHREIKVANSTKVKETIHVKSSYGMQNTKSTTATNHVLVNDLQPEEYV